MNWWDTRVDSVICPLLFPRMECIWNPNVPIGRHDERDPFHEECPLPAEQQQPPSETSSIAGDYNPFPEEDEASFVEDEDDDGEGEQLLLDEEPKERHVTRSQAARYHMQIRAPPRHPGPPSRNPWHDPHWLWWGRRLAEYFTCLINNRIDRQKYANINKYLGDLRYVIPRYLVEAFEREVQAQQGDIIAFVLITIQQ